MRAELKAIVCLMNYRYRFLHGHSRRVTRYATKIANALGMRKREIVKIRIAALLHDVGKLRIDKTILNKPGKLTGDDWKKIKRHPITSIVIIKRQGILDADIIDIILHHHTHFDGNGYPNSKKKGEEIPLGARILAVADSYEAMTSTRPYRKAPLSREEAFAELKRSAGTQFDPAVVDAFIETIA
jgi:putative nucleotidyltransferase with HDIG domain